MASFQPRYRTLPALWAVGLSLLLTACSAPGLMNAPAVGRGLSGIPSPTALLDDTPRLGSIARAPGVLADAGDSVFRVVAWSMAIVAGSLVLAFVARLLNHRPKKEVL